MLQVLDLFQKYLWPGNIRELENIIRRAVFKGRTEWIRLEDLPFDFAQKIVGVAGEAGGLPPTDAGAFTPTCDGRHDTLPWQTCWS